MSPLRDRPWSNMEVDVVQHASGCGNREWMVASGKFLGGMELKKLTPNKFLALTTIHGSRACAEVVGAQKRW